MIVEPDFLDHWRTMMVVNALGDPMAPIYIMRIWAHCQNRRGDRFAMPALGLKAQCRYSGEAEKLELALIEAGFISRDGEFVVVLGWAEQNKKLIANWVNGSKGGRPQGNNGEPIEIPEQTQTEPNGNPTETHTICSATQPDPIRVDKKRKIKSIAHPSDAPKFSAIDFLLQAGVESQIANDWLKVRKEKRLPPTKTALEDVVAEVDQAGLSVNEALKICCVKGWAGFKAKWPRDGPASDVPVWEQP